LKERIFTRTDRGGVEFILPTCEEIGLKIPETASEIAKKLKEKLPVFDSVKNLVDLTGSVKDEHYIVPFRKLLGTITILQLLVCSGTALSYSRSCGETPGFCR
jgi:acyl-CoA synthetase (NDP forming)